MTEDADASTPVFRLATCDDFVRLRKRYPDASYGSNSEPTRWSLKLCSLMWVLEQIRLLKPRRVLEVGGGVETFFDTRMAGLGVEEYWMIDRPWDYYPHREAQDRALTASRTGVKFVEGMIGAGSSALPDNYFDLVFSVTVWFHRDSGGGPVVYPTLVAEFTDCRRVLKPGGALVGGTPFALSNAEGFPTIFASRLEMSGFTTGAQLPLRPSIHGDPTMFEALGIVWESYKNADGKVWETMPHINNHYATVLSRQFA